MLWHFIWEVFMHLLLFITEKYTTINANLKLINAKLQSFFHSTFIDAMECPWMQMVTYLR